MEASINQLKIRVRKYSAILEFRETNILRVILYGAVLRKKFGVTPCPDTGGICGK